MTTLFPLLVSITTVFILLLFLKESISKSKRFCVICAAVSLTWMTFLVLSWLKLVENTIALALLMGQSITGIYYMAESKVSKEVTVFRLPFLLTLTVLAYSLITAQVDISAMLLGGGVWIATLLIYGYRTHPTTKKLVQKLIACCRRW